MKRNYILLELIKEFTQSEIYEYTKVTHSYLRLIGYGHKQASAKVAIAIERFSGGLVRRTDVREDWADIWPEYDPKRPAKGNYPKFIQSRIDAFVDKQENK